MGSPDSFLNIHNMFSVKLPKLAKPAVIDFQFDKFHYDKEWELNLRPQVQLNILLFGKQIFNQFIFFFFFFQPLIEKAIEEKGGQLTKVEAVKLLIECLKILYYRDARSINKVCFVDN